jgi:hypothetical protein
LSQSPYPPVGPATPQARPLPPRAAPTQIAYPGQVHLPPQPQYAAPPQAAPQQFATGFPHYVPPPPSPRRLTGYIVGTVVVVLTVLYAVIGFWLVS